MGVWQWSVETDEFEADAQTRQLLALENEGNLTLSDSSEHVDAEDFASFEAGLRRVAVEGDDFRRDLHICDSTGEDRWVAAKAALIRDAQGKPKCVTGVLFDISETKQLEERRELVSHELNHRIKNVFAVVNALVALSARNAESVDAFKESLHDRLNALSKTSDIAQHPSQDQSASIRQLLSAQLSQYSSRSSPNVIIEGPELVVKPEAALSLGLAFHELATNAAKYGALRNSTGKLFVEWQVKEQNGESSLVFEWRESGGPPVEAPTREGFGTRLLKRAIGASFQGDLAMEYAPEGLVCRMSLPLRNIEAGDPRKRDPLWRS